MSIERDKKKTQNKNHLLSATKFVWLHTHYLSSTYSNASNDKFTERKDLKLLRIVYNIVNANVVIEKLVSSYWNLHLDRPFKVQTT